MRKNSPSFGQPLRVSVEGVIADKQKHDGAGPLEFEAGRGELEFYYTALSFRSPERTRFRYKLEGVDLDWVEADTRRVAYYNHVYPGQYVST